MSSLTEAQTKEILSTLFPEQAKESPPPEPELEENKPEPRELQVESWSRLVGKEWDNDSTPAEQRAFIAPVVENIGPQIGLLFQNSLDALKLNVLESARRKMGVFETEEGREELNREIDEEVSVLMADIEAGIKKVEDLNPQELNTVQEGLRSGLISFAVMAPALLLSIFARSPTPMIASMSLLTGADSYTTGRNEGLSHKDALKYGAVDGLIEGATEILPATLLLKLFPGAKNAAGGFSKRAFKYLLSDVGGEQAATYLQNLNAYGYGLDEQMLAIEGAFETGTIDGLEKEELIGDLLKQRAAVTFIATLFQGSLQVSVAKMVEFGMSEQEIQEELEGTLIDDELSEAERQAAYDEFAAVEEFEETTPGEKIRLGIAKTGAANILATKRQQELYAEREALLLDPELKKDPKKLKKELKKIDTELGAVEEQIKRIEKTRRDFEGMEENMVRLDEIEQELADNEDPEVKKLLEQEQTELTANINVVSKPETAADRREPIEYTPFDPEEGMIALEETPEAEKQGGKNGFFNPTVQRLYDVLVDKKTGNEIVSAYNLLRQKMAEYGYNSTGFVEQDAPRIIKQTQKDLRRLLRLSKSLLNKNRAIMLTREKLAEGKIEQKEADQKILSANKDIANIEANLVELYARAEQKVEPLPDLPENRDNPYGKNSRFFAPGPFKKFIRKLRGERFDGNVIVYRPSAESGPGKEVVALEGEEEAGPTAVIPFKKLDADSIIRLYFYDLSGGKMEVLKDPLTGNPFSAEYDGIEFINPLSGTLELDPGLLPSIEMDGKTYQALWEPGTLSTSTSRVSSDPAMAPNTSVFTNTEIAAFYWDRFKSFFRPRGVRSTIMEELQSGPEGPIAKEKLSSRQLTRMFREFAEIQEKMQLKIEEGLLKVKTDIFEEGVIFEDGIAYLSPEETLLHFKRLVANAWKGDKEAQIALGRSGQTELLKAIKDGRDRISKNTTRIIKLVKLIDPEASTYTKEKIKVMEDTIGTYMGRAFGAYIFPDWKAPNRKTATQAEKMQHALAVEQLAELYQKKKGEAEGLSMEDHRREAERDMNILYNGESSQRSEIFVNMFDMTPPYVSVDKTQQKILAPTLKGKRTDIPEEVRKALGELSEPEHQAQQTAYKQEQFIAITEFLLDLKEIGTNPNTRFLSKVQTGRYNTEIIIPGDVLNPLNGSFTTKQMAQAIMKTMGYGPLKRYLSGISNMSDSSKKIYLKTQGGLGLVNIAYLLLSVKTQSRNFVSAMGFPITAGNWQAYKHPKEAFKFVMASIENMSREEQDFLVKEGITASSIAVGEHRAVMDLMQGAASWQEFYDSVEKRQLSLLDAARKKGREALRIAEATYVGADDLPKIMNYLGERDSLYGIYAPQGIENLTAEQVELYIDMISESIVEQGGSKVTRSGSTAAENLDKAIRQRASFLTRRNIPNYNRLPNVLDALRAAMAANFAGFPTAIITSEANILRTAITDFNLSFSSDPALDPGVRRRLRQRAASRAAINIGWILGPGTIMTAASALRFAGRVATSRGGKVGGALLTSYALSKFVAEWAQNNNFVFATDVDEDGVFEVFDFSHTDGYTLIGEPARLLLKYFTAGKYMDEDAQKHVFDTLLKSLKNITTTYTNEKIFKKVILDVLAGENRETGNALFDPSLGFWDTLEPRLEHAARELSPRVFRETVEIGKAVVLTGEEALDRDGRKRNLLRALANAIGFKTNRIDPKTIINDYKLSDFNNAYDQSKSYARQVFYRAEGSELGYDNMQAMVDSYDELQRQHFDQVRDLRLDIHWMAPFLGTPTAEVLTHLENQTPSRILQFEKTDRLNILDPASENPLYLPTKIDSFLKTYTTELLKIQEAAGISDQEIEARVETLGEQIEEQSYKKWAAKPVRWTMDQIELKVGEYEEQKENGVVEQDITKPTTAELVETLFPTKD